MFWNALGSRNVEEDKESSSYLVWGDPVLYSNPMKNDSRKVSKDFEFAFLNFTLCSMKEKLQVPFLHLSAIKP